MIEITKYAELIQNGINEYAKLYNIEQEFKIHSQVGNYFKAIRETNGKLKRFVNGIMTLNMGNFTPVEEIENLTTVFSLEFLVVQEDKDEVSDLLSIWAKDQIGIVKSVEDTNFLMTPTLPETGVAKNTSIGAAVSIRMSITVQSIRAGLLSNMVQWSINGKDIKVEQASISTQRTTLDRPNANLEYIRTSNSWSSTTISMTIPYSFGTTENPSIAVEIANNIMTDNMSEEFVITRKESADSPRRELGTFVLTNGNIMEESERIVSISCTFSRKEK